MYFEKIMTGSCSKEQSIYWEPAGEVDEAFCTEIPLQLYLWLSKNKQKILFCIYNEYNKNEIRNSRLLQMVTMDTGLESFR